MACRSGSARFIVWGKYHEGEIILAPMDVHFDKDNILQPDILYIRRDNLHIIRDGWVFGVPDLVVEILSENTGKRDKTIKKDTYERFGVGEYWLADPVYRIVDQFVLADGQYRMAGTWTEQDVIVSHTISCLSVRLGGIFPAEN